jgi:hypothetical protein
MQNDMRNRLVELLDDCRYIEGYGIDLVEKQADHLIANGVVLPPKPKPPIDLKGKCGSCIYAKPTTFGNSTIYVECTNIEHLARFCCNHEFSKKRQRTHKGCKNYKFKDQAEQKLKELRENG